jgi:hypothetical protein
MCYLKVLQLILHQNTNLHLYSSTFGALWNLFQALWRWHLDRIGAERQDVRAMVTILSVNTSNLFRTFFKAMNRNRQLHMLLSCWLIDLKFYSQVVLLSVTRNLNLHIKSILKINMICYHSFTIFWRIVHGLTEPTKKYLGGIHNQSECANHESSEVEGCSRAGCAGW